MSHCLRTGYGFANGRKLGDYFYGNRSNYDGARAMVNGHDSAQQISAAARDFVVILQQLGRRQ